MSTAAFESFFFPLLRAETPALPQLPPRAEAPGSRRARGGRGAGATGGLGRAGWGHSPSPALALPQATLF